MACCTALAKVNVGVVQSIQDYGDALIGGTGDDILKPPNCRLLVSNKIFSGGHSPINFILTDGMDSIIGVPLWPIGDMKEKGKAIRKAKMGVKKFSIIELEEYIVLKRKMPMPANDEHGNYQVVCTKYRVIKKVVEPSAVQHWKDHEI